VDVIKWKKLVYDCRTAAIERQVVCHYPGCQENAINSHILQKNGILNVLARDGLLYDFSLNHFAYPPFEFKKIGLKKIFSFNCFCQKHDRDLFFEIERQSLDFSNYFTCLLFTIRTSYNEFFRKDVNLKSGESILKSGFLNYQWEIEHEDAREQIEQIIEEIEQSIIGSKQGLEDIIRTQKFIWKDHANRTESFVFKVRKIAFLEVCLSSFFTYETTNEINAYLEEHRENMESLSDIFISVFPYNNETIFMMGYLKKDETKVKAYINEFFTIPEKKLHRKLTNLMLFNCENWVVSEKFYNEKLEKVESILIRIPLYLKEEGNERKNFDINFFSNNFHDKLIQWAHLIGLTGHITDQ
jgi:hypothetical protein